jgi:aminopeptidase N
MRNIIAMLAASLAAASVASAEEAFHHCGTCMRMEQLFAAGAADWDEKTGASTDHFPIERKFDLEHVRLELAFPELSRREATARATLILSAPWEPLDSITLQASGLRIDRVELLPEAALAIATDADAALPRRGEELEFFHDDKELRIAFAEPVGRGARVAVAIEYRIVQPRFGLNWIAPLPDDPDTRWEVWSQGQPESSRGWFPTHDYPNEFHTSEVIATVPLPNTASAAGVLHSRRENGDGTATYHWRMELPHTSYLTTLVVGQFAVTREEHNGVALEYYVPPARAEDAARTFRRTGEMLDVFGERFSEPYPYPRYAQLVVREFTAGGMENVTATTLTSRVLQGSAADRHQRVCNGNMEGLIAHELAHQWFGDMITCRTWSHLWLNEGWASYAEELWAEAGCSRQDYEFGLWKRRNRIVEGDTVESGRPLVFIRTPDAGTMFGFNGSAVYNKGAYTLHMLRTHVGDEAFFKGVAAYIDRHRFGTATTDDFRKAIEEASGRDLEAWFRQWTGRPGTPRLAVSLAYEPAAREAVVTIEQTQPISVDVPAFRGSFRLRFVTAAGTTVDEVVELTERRHTFRVALDGAPRQFAPDPDGGFLSGLTLTVPVAVLAETAAKASTTFARLTAIRGLEANATPAAAEALASVVADTGQFHGVRTEAANSLAKVTLPESRAALLSFADAALAAPADWPFQVRAAVAAGLAIAPEEDAVPRLLQLAEDPAESVAQSAAQALGQMLGGGDIDAALMALAERRGDHDRLLGEATGALLKRGSPRALDAALLGAEPRTDYRVRRDAVRSIGDALDGMEGLDAENPGIVRLLEILDEPRTGTVREAATSLGKARWKPAIAKLDALSRSTSDTDLAARAKEAIASIRTGTGSREEVRALAEKVAALEARLEEPKRGAERERRRSEKKRRRFLGIF